MHRKNIILSGYIYLVALLSLQSPLSAYGMESQWSMGFGDALGQASLSMVTDQAGNIILTGFFEGSINFGGGLLTSIGGRDIFLVKFDRFGNHIWSRRYGDKSDQTGYGVAVDSSGDVVLTGSFAGTVDFGGIPYTAAGGKDIFLARFNAAGQHLWSRVFGDTLDQIGYSVAIDGSGNIIVTGELSGSADFGGGSISSHGGRDIFLVRFGSNGAYHWSRCFGDGADQVGRNVMTDGSNNILITGSLEGDVDFGGGALSTMGGQDVFLAKFDTFSNYQWAQSFGDALNQLGKAIAVDDAGNVTLIGDFEGYIDFGGGPLSSAGGWDLFLVQFNAYGNYRWSRGFGDGLDQSSADVDLNTVGDIVATGYFEGAVDFGGGQLISSGSRDIFLCVYNRHGVHLLSQAFGNTADQAGTAVSVAPSGSALASGTFFGSVDFGNGTLASAGNSDIYLASFGCQGDFDQDGDVDGSDLFLFADRFESSSLIDEFSANFGRADCQ